MKKLLLILVAATMTLAGYAAGKGDGSSKADAIEFDWTNGNTQEAGTFWYKVTFGNRLEVDAPNLALNLTNLSSSSAKVEISAQYGADEEKRDYTIAGNGVKVWNTSASMIRNMVKDDEGLYVKLTTNQKVHLSAKVYEGSLADDACLKATAYDYAPHSLKAGTHWYTINLNALREANKGIKITYKAESGTSKIVSMVSTDCPSTGLSGLKGSIPNGKTKTHEISATLIKSMKESTLYLKVENTKTISVVTETPDGPDPVKDVVNFSNPIDYDMSSSTKEAVGATAKVYRVALADLIPVVDENDDNTKGNKYLQPQIALDNEANVANPAYVTIQIAFSKEAVDNLETADVITKLDTVVAGETGFVDFARNILESLDAENCKYVYIRITANRDMQASARLKHMREGNACKSAKEVKWDETIYQKVDFEEESSTQWYAIDITALKDVANPQDVTVTVTNNGDATANITAELAFACPYIDLQTITRQVEVGKPMSKTIKYSSIATLGSNVIYVGVTTTQDVTIKAVPSTAKTKPESEVTCDKAEEYKPVDFDLENGHKQAANVVVWYKVKAGDIKKAFGEDIPEIVVTNEGDKKLTVTGELSKNCPDIYENQTRSLTIGANDVYKKEIAKDLFMKYEDSDVFYIKLTGNQPFNFRLNKKIENEGASCAKAIPFNWTTGHNQDADVTLWYVIDLTEIQNTKQKKVHVILKNLTGKDATIDGMLATDCPCASPQNQSLALKANEVKTKDVPRSAFLSFGEKVYIRLTGTQKFHFEAQIQDADPFTPITVCEPATEIDVNTLINGTAGETWYKIQTSKLVDAELAPRVMVINGATAQTLTAAIAYECPVTEEMMSRSQAFAAKQTISKLFEQSLVNQIASKNEYAYVRVNATQDYQFIIEMVDPNTGADCQHAVEIKDGKKIGHEAGKTLWYKLNVADLLANHANEKLVFSLTNTDGKAGAVHAVALTDCEGKEIISGNASIGANAKREKSIMVEALMGLNTPWVYVQLTAAQAQDLLMKIIGRDPLQPGTFNACETGTVPFAVNTDYNQNAADTVWYRVNIKAIRENTTGDATLIVTDLSGEENTLSAEIAWVCPVEYEMTGKTMMLKGNDVYTRIFSRDMLNSAEGRDEAFIRVISEKQMKFRVNMHLSKGDECSNPIEFDWVNGNTNPAGECLWYNVAMLDEFGNMRVTADKDLRLTIVNLSDDKAYASADIRFECKEPSLGSKQYSFGPRDTVQKVIDGRLIDQAKPTSIVVNLCTQKSSMFIKAEVIDNETDSICFEDRKLILCDGEVYNDVMTTTVIPHLINAADPATLAWNDTIQKRVGTILVDSIYRFTVTAQIAAEHLDYTTVPEESKIKANDGENLDYSAFEAYLVKYYTDLATAYDSIAGYDKILWEAFNPEISDFDDINNVPVATNVLTYATTKNLVLAYTVVTTCGSEIYDTIQVDVVKGCDDVFDMTTLDIDWGKAYCGLPYDTKAVKKQIQDAFDAAGVKDDMKLYFDLGNGFKEIDNTVMTKGATVKFYAEAISTCDATQKAVTATKTVTVEKPDAKGDQVTNLPLVSELDNWVLVIDLKSINDTYDLNLVQGDETEKKVEWYKDGVKIKEGGYYYADNKQLDGGNYYAIITIAEGEDNCGGSWRTEVRNIQKAASVGVRKQMINGKLYIITEDNVMYDAQGQIVQ